jgi:RecB family exonuclease
VRLAGKAVESPDLGWDARKRGNLVHRVLEKFWGEVKTQEALLAMTAEERRTCLRGQIEAALGTGAGEGGDGADGWARAYREVQRRRLERLLGAWLEVEAGREPFAVRLSEEKLTDVRIGPLRLDVRVDRVDETEFGDVLIDYKTGAAKPGEWAGERPDRPQLPLYAVLTAGKRDLAGVAFGSVRAGKEMGMAGYATRTEGLPKVAKHEFKDLPEQVEAWREVLTKLAEDFAAGDTRVNPKAYPTTCTFCPARILCRLDASLLEMDDTDDEEEMGEPDLG